ncbi:hypothetical protein BO70DRAFT_319401, partial [Aspergillus heteromorphus CBS 117.55]
MPQISTAIETAAAEGRIPAGITLEYLAQSRDQPAKIAIFCVSALATVIVIARCYARLFIVKKFGWDDALAVLTVLIYFPIVALCMVLIDLGSGRHIEYIEYVLSLTQVDETEVYDFVMHVLYTTALFTCRLSGLAFYQRLASCHRKISLAIKGSAGFLLAAYLVQFLLLLLHCLPVTGLWPYAWQPQINEYQCITWGEVYVANSVLSLICDLMMLTLPALLIHGLHVSRKRKLELSLILFPGVLVLVISSVRMYLVFIGQWSSDGSWAYDPMLAIETSEIGSTLIALSTPALKSLFGTWLSHLQVSPSEGPSCEAGVKLAHLAPYPGEDTYQVSIGAGEKAMQAGTTPSSSEDLLLDGSFVQ